MSYKRLATKVTFLTSLTTLLPRVVLASASGWQVNTVFGISVKSGGQPLASLINQVLNIAYALSGGCALLMIMYGSIRYIGSGGDPKANQEAKDIIKSAFTGLVLVLIAFLIAEFIGGDALTSTNI
jgi:hypothetical protein